MVLLGSPVTTLSRLRHAALLAASRAPPLLPCTAPPSSARCPAVPCTRRGSHAQQTPSTLQPSMLCLRMAC